jgi:hypothetical protein
MTADSLLSLWLWTSIETVCLSLIKQSRAIIFVVMARCLELLRLAEDFRNFSLGRRQPLSHCVPFLSFFDRIIVSPFSLAPPIPVFPILADQQPDVLTTSRAQV